jgi:hypothetical protein
VENRGRENGGLGQLEFIEISRFLDPDRLLMFGAANIRKPKFSAKASQYPKPKPGTVYLTQVFVRIGRGDKIRTCDPLHPMQVRYQAAPRPDRGSE